MFFITKSYFKVPKDVRINISHFFVAKISNRRELQQIAINHSSGINTKDFGNIYRKRTSETSFIVIDNTLASNKPSNKSSEKIFLVYIIKIMTINDQIRDEKLRDNINRKAANKSSKSSDKFHEYEYLTVEDILPSNQQQIIEQAKFNYSPLGKTLEKQIKAIENRGKKQVDALEKLKPKEKTKPLEDKPNNQSRNTITFNELIKKIYN